MRSCTAGQRAETSITLVFRDGNGFYAFGRLRGEELGEELRSGGR